MVRKTLMIMGGYGITGCLLSRLLVKETDANLILAGRRIERAEEAALRLNEICGENRARGMAVDAANPAGMRRAFDGVDMVVVASNTTRFARQVACAALDAGSDYYDLQYSNEKIAVLKSLAPQIEQAGRCFITDGGFHPGLPAALVRYAAPFFDRLDSAVVGSVIKEDWAGHNVPEETIIELVEALNDYVTLVYKQGRWQDGGFWSMMSTRTMDFGDVFHRQACVSMFLEEMRSLPELYPTLQETGFFVGGFNWLTDWVIMPLVMVAMKLWPEKMVRPAGRWMKWGLETFSKPPFGTVLKLEARGLANNGLSQVMEVTLAHPEGYYLTAVPIAACLRQYLDGSIKKPGLWTQANLVEPNRLMDDMKRMGVEIRIERRSA